jgi:acyl carrier protein
MTSPLRATPISSFVLCIWLACAGCGAQSTHVDPQSVEQVRGEVAKILNKKTTEIDVVRPLMAQGADELDIVEIVMALEEVFKLEIPDSAIGENYGEACKSLNVQKLAELVSKKEKK